jgi:hypothetical protein
VREQDTNTERLRAARKRSRTGNGGGSAKGVYMNGKTKLACNVGNVMYALGHEPEIMNAFGYDEMLRCEILLRPLFINEPNFKPRPVTDARCHGRAILVAMVCLAAAWQGHDASGGCQACARAFVSSSARLSQPPAMGR